jgi:MFS family permease
VPTVFLGLVVYRFLDNRPEEAAWLDAQEKALLARQVGSAEGAGHSMRGAITAPGFLMLAIVYFLMQVASYGLNFWGPDLIRSSGIADPTALGFLAAVPYLCGAAVMVVLARRCDASGRRLGAVISCLLVAAAGFALAATFAGATWLVVLALALIGGGVVAAIPGFWALPPRLMAGVGAAGGIALINTIGQMGGIVSPAMVGWIKDHTGSTTLALYVIAGAAVLAAAILAFLSPPSLRRADRG